MDEQRTRIGIGLIAAVGLAVMLVVRFGKCGRDHSFEVPPVVTPAAAALAPANEAIEFQLAVGDQVVDLAAGKPVELDGAKVDVVRTPTWVSAGPGFHVTHASSVSVSSTPDTLIASIDGAMVKLQVMDPKETAAEHESLLAFAVTGSGQVRGEPRPARRAIAGAERTGKRYATVTALEVELYLVAVGNQTVGVLLYHTDPRSQLGRLDEALASLAEGTGTPRPLFTARAGGAEVPLQLDQPAELPLAKPVAVTLRRRPLVRRTMSANGGTLTFEHARNLAVSQLPNTELLAVTIQSETVSVQLMDMPIRVTTGELLRQLGTSASDGGEIIREHAGKRFTGRKVRLAQMPIETEIYTFDRAGRTVTAMVQFPTAAQTAALEIALPIIASVR